jgi:hypothetical protein
LLVLARAAAAGRQHKPQPRLGIAAEQVWLDGVVVDLDMTAERPQEAIMYLTRIAVNSKLDVQRRSKLNVQRS